jgi:beta-mannosidase
MTLAPATNDVYCPRSGFPLRDASLKALAIDDAFAAPPLTVEGWVRLNSALESNILVVNEQRDSPTHWALCTEAETGMLCAHFAWHEPFEIKANVSITDNVWHWFSLQFDSQGARLSVDALAAPLVPLKRITLPGNVQRTSAPLMLGIEPAPTPIYDCAGEIAELRISHGLRPAMQRPRGALDVDAQTLALWRFNDEQNEFADLTGRGNALRCEPKPVGSLDELDRASYHAGPTLQDAPPITISLTHNTAAAIPEPITMELNGIWELVEGDIPPEQIPTFWEQAIPAAVPGSIHAALVNAGRIPDPTFGENDALAREFSFKTWWLRKRFKCPAGLHQARLSFGGVAVHCTVWLNGTLLGEHEGMFGGPEFDVSEYLREDNALVVKIASAPHEISEGWPNNFFLGMNVGWMRTVVFNNVYGWHYSNIPSIGIWRPVQLRAIPAVAIQHPFLTTQNAAAGLVDLHLELRSHTAPNCSGLLTGTIAPENFSGTPLHFSFGVTSSATKLPLRLQCSIPDPQLWWPNDLGEPNLYRLTLQFSAAAGGNDVASTIFGIRTIEMAPLPGGQAPGRYNWTFVINGRPSFVKGTGWCTMDPLMDFSRERYERFLTLADDQHVQMLRAWGSGMPETDDFYDLCDRKGIMVMQEWPTAWNSHQWQPYDVLEETVRLNTLRLRNHPSLVMWGAGNESDKPFGSAIDMMGRTAIELDGTRPFHRGEPWGGSRHDYTCWWGRQPLDYNLTLTSHFFGEFGLASMPVLESVQRYLPEHEKTAWPPAADSVLAHHTPVFNKMDDLSRALQYSADFTKNDSLANMIFGSQLAQAVGVRHTLERARTRWPHCSGALYYKMNDNYPAASWSCVDWYGAPKMGHYFFQDAFAPLHAVCLFEKLDVRGQGVELPVFLLDDAETLQGPDWEVCVRAFDGTLQPLASRRFQGSAGAVRVHRLGSFMLSEQHTASVPLFIVIEVRQAKRLLDRTFYFLNHTADIGCLLRLPTTQLAARADGLTIHITNVGKVPAVGAAVLQPGHLDLFGASNNYVWLDVDESTSIDVSSCAGLQVEAWNVAPQICQPDEAAR